MALGKKRLDIKTFLIYLAILALFLFLAFIQINKPLRGEQSYFAYASHKLADNDKTPFSLEGYKLPAADLFLHPPLYIYSIALFIKLFGYNLFALKLSSILFTVLTSFLLLLMGLYLFPENKKIALISVFIYLINPIVIQNALLLDMDGGILTFFSIATIFCFMRYKLEKPFLLGILLVLGLWTKTTIFVTLSVGFFIYLVYVGKEKIFSKNKAKILFKLIAIFVISLIIFFATYYLFSLVMNSDATRFIKQNTTSKFSNRFSEGILTNVLRWAGGIKTLVIWINPLITLFFFFILFRDIKKILTKKIKPERALMYIITIVAFGFFIITGVANGSTGKYFVFIVPLLALLISEEFSKVKFDLEEIILILTALSIMIIEYYLIFLKDPIFTKDIWMVISQFNLALVFSIIVKVAVILLPLVVLFLIFRRNLIFIFIFMILLFTSYSAIYTSFAKYSTNNNYGDYGIGETVNYLKNLTNNQNATIITERGVAFLWCNGNYMEEQNNNAYVYSVSSYYIYVDKFYNNATIVKNNTYLAIYEQNLYRMPGFKEHVDNHFDYLKSIGYYQVYKIKGT